MGVGHEPDRPASAQQMILPHNIVEGLRARYPEFDALMIRRLARAYGTRVPEFLRDARATADFGRDFGAGLTEAEVNYLVEREWAMTAADVVWRRTKLGLRLSKPEIEELDAFMKAAQPAARVAVGGLGA